MSTQSSSNDGLCPNCGASPCYHICPNSEHFYSPEQERADDAWYGMDDHSERYAATAEPSQYYDEPYDDDEYMPNPVTGYSLVPVDPDDIPF